MSNPWFCNHCQTDFSESNNRNSLTGKVIVDNYANILCTYCERLLNEELREIAQKYLKPKQIFPLTITDFPEEKDEISAEEKEEISKAGGGSIVE